MSYTDHSVQRRLKSIYIYRKAYNDTSRYLSKQNACGKVKCKFSFFIQVQTVRKEQKKVLQIYFNMLSRLN